MQCYDIMVAADPLECERGVPQGAPESPGIYGAVAEDLLADLLDSWVAQERERESWASGWTPTRSPTATIATTFS